MNEFDLIQNYFAAQKIERPDVTVGIGDDTAIVQIPKQQALAITTDTLVAGIHFLELTNPFDIGYKALAVNLSDLAAEGAAPAWITLAITLPKADESWINSFCDGLFTLANLYQIQLIGGDLTHGPLSITIQAMGFVPPQQALLRSKANPGDLIYVTGTLGDAALALSVLRKAIDVTKEAENYLLLRLNQPSPRIEAGLKLRGIAHAAIDISDGLAADLDHICKASQVGAIVYVDQLPLSSVMKESVSSKQAIEFALTGGDDYELCFTIPENKKALLETTFAEIACGYTCIGKITAEKNLQLRYQDGNEYHGSLLGYQHF